MSTPGRSFRTYCLTKTAVTDEIGQRFYPNRIPQNATFPLAIYTTITHTPQHHMGGAAALTRTTLQVDIFAETRVACEDAAEGFRDAADGYRGTAGSEFFQTCHLTQQRDDFDEPVDGSDAPLWRISQDWLIGVTESTPSL